jgi:hypothetical protein
MDYQETPFPPARGTNKCFKFFYSGQNTPLLRQAGIYHLYNPNEFAVGSKLVALLFSAIDYFRSQGSISNNAIYAYSDAASETQRF